MMIHHHHTIHICSACSGCSCSHERRDEHERSETSRSPFSFLSAIGDFARLVASVALLHRPDEESDHTGVDIVPEPIGSPSTATGPDTMMAATDAARCETLRALFARGIERKEQTASAVTDGGSDDTGVSLSPLAAAFLSVLRGEPTFA